MFAIARYRLVDYYRVWERTKQKEIDGEDLWEAISFERQEPEDENRHRLHEAIEQLPDKQRITVQMLKLQGLSIKEVAAEVGQSESWVKVNAHRAYKALKRNLGTEIHGN